jgi:hypothetical protein
MSAVTEQTISAWSAKGLRHPCIEPGMTKLSPAASSASSASSARYTGPCTTEPTNRLSLTRNRVASGWLSWVSAVPAMRNSRNDRLCSGGRATSPARTPDSSRVEGTRYRRQISTDIVASGRTVRAAETSSPTSTDRPLPFMPVTTRRPSLSAETISRPLIHTRRQSGHRARRVEQLHRSQP